MSGTVAVNGANLWYQVTGDDGDSLIQVHGSAFAHTNFDLVTPRFAEYFQVVDFDLRGYGSSDRPSQHYDFEVWADDIVNLQEALGISRSHIHGVSMGSMIVLLFAAKYPERTRSVVLTGAAAKLGLASRLIFKNWIDIATHDPQGTGSRILAELMTWQALARDFVETDGGGLVDRVQATVQASVGVDVFAAACNAMCAMDLTALLSQVTAPCLVIGGEQDLLTPWDQGPTGAGQEAIFRAVPIAEKVVIPGSGHAPIYDNTAAFGDIVLEFLVRHSSHVDRAAARASHVTA